MMRLLRVTTCISALLKVFLKWVPFATTLTLICALIYGVVQQDLRQTANDPQIQIAEATASELAQVKRRNLLSQWKDSLAFELRA